MALAQMLTLLPRWNVKLVKQGGRMDPRLPQPLEDVRKGVLPGIVDEAGLLCIRRDFPQRGLELQGLTRGLRRSGFRPKLIPVRLELFEIDLARTDRPEAPVASRVAQIAIRVSRADEDAPATNRL